MFSLGLLWSCEEEGEEEEEVVDPDFTIISTEGLNLGLSWEGGDSFEETIELLDLDLKLFSGASLLFESVDADSFETLTLQSTFSNLSYAVRAEYWKGDIDAPYTLTLEVPDGETTTLTGTLTREDDYRRDITLINIIKEDSTYGIVLNDAM